MERFHIFSRNRIDLVPYQDLLGKFPKAPELDYKRSLVFFTTDNKIYKGAAAVYRFYMELGAIGGSNYIPGLDGLQPSQNGATD